MVHSFWSTCVSFTCLLLSGNGNEISEEWSLGDVALNSSTIIPLRLALAKGRRSAILSNSVSQDEADEVKECDRVFTSTGGVINGTFESPKVETASVQCVYTFVPRPGERVQISFTSFNVRGIPPECAHEWVDMYTEVDGSDVSELISTPFAGRYCGQIPPRTRISLYGGIAIGFYSDKNGTAEEGENVRFQGTYTFVKEDRYVVGTPVPRTICSFSILGTSKRSGELLSPTYPGVYPKDLSCSYKFTGTPGQRIRIEFRDFDVFAGGAHCPFDDVKAYDGMDANAPLIGTYCGQHRNLLIYSSQHLLLLIFTTNERTLETQNRGFFAVWEFSESFVKLDFITKNAGEHIRGTECDQRILSQGKGTSANSTGFVYSPNYPFPYLPKNYCRYFIYGVQDPQNLERVRISFDKFDVPSTTHSEEEQTSSSLATEKQQNKCGDGYLKIYIKGQELSQQYDKHDFEFCGKELPHEVASDGPRVVLIFSSGETQGSGFRAKYSFETEYRVPGTPAPDGTCQFSYSSTSAKRGEFNSPRFPSNYPSDLNCVYVFHAEPTEQVRIVFDHFKVRMDSPNFTGGAYGPEVCTQDWVEIYNVFKGRPDRLVGRYCNVTAPGPIESHEEAEAVKVLLHTDHEGVYSGFKARYIFFTATSIFGECGMNFSQKLTGVLTSPGWPNKYEGPRNREGSNRCNWFLAAKPGHRVLLHFSKFSIEGDPGVRGCPSAAVRIWEDPDGLPVELCGETLQPAHTQFVSLRNLMRVTFITADKAVGNEGFYAIWTEVQDRYSLASSCPPTYSKCEKNPFCIHDDLRCNGVNNCGILNGSPDSADEDTCGLESEINLLLVIGLGGACSTFCLLSLCAWSHRKRRKRRRRMQLRRPPIHVCDNAGARFAAMDNV